MGTWVLRALGMSVLLVGISCGPEDEAAASRPEESARAWAVATSKPLYAFELQDIDGSPMRLADYRGKVLLLVNVASKCGYTRQYAGLQALYERFRGQGLVVIGFPANNFGSQEPGTNQQIKEFCSTRFGVTFPTSAKISVQGADIHPLYQFLTTGPSHPEFGGDITWNFNKFLVSRGGNVIARYDSPVEPLSSQLISDVEAALKQTPQEMPSSEGA